MSSSEKPSFSLKDEWESKWGSENLWDPCEQAWEEGSWNLEVLICSKRKFICDLETYPGVLSNANANCTKGNISMCWKPHKSKGILRILLRILLSRSLKFLCSPTIAVSVKLVALSTNVLLVKAYWEGVREGFNKPKSQKLSGGRGGVIPFW